MFILPSSFCISVIRWPYMLPSWIFATHSSHSCSACPVCIKMAAPQELSPWKRFGWEMCVLCQKDQEHKIQFENLILWEISLSWSVSDYANSALRRLKIEIGVWKFKVLSWELQDGQPSCHENKETRVLWSDEVLVPAWLVLGQYAPWLFVLLEARISEPLTAQLYPGLGCTAQFFTTAEVTSVIKWLPTACRIIHWWPFCTCCSKCNSTAQAVGLQCTH